MNNRIDITATPDKWREGDIAEFTFDGVLGHTGPLRRSVESNWLVGATLIRSVWGYGEAKLTDLRVTRSTPTLPDHDNAVIQWNSGREVQTAEGWKGGWRIAGEEQAFFSAELLARIGDATISVATFSPLDGA